MNPSELKLILEEVHEHLTGKVVGRMFQLGRTAFAVDLLPHSGVYLFADYSFQNAATFLIRRRRREMERKSLAPSRLLVRLQSELQDNQIISTECSSETALLIHTEQAAAHDRTTLVLDVAGQIPNVLLLDRTGSVVVAARSDDAQAAGHPAQNRNGIESSDQENRQVRGSLSEILDREYLARTAEDSFKEKAASARKKITSEIAKRKRLRANLQADLDRHGDADQWKRFGDLILANLGQLRRYDDSIIVTDFYDPELAELAIPAESNLEPTEVANEYFRRYSKARNAQNVVQERLSDVEKELEQLEQKRERLETAISDRDEDRLSEFVAPVKTATYPVPSKKVRTPEKVKGVRRFLSTDGFEIWVGKKAADNDVLTFRLAKSLEYWLHAADYPGSHVIIRNPRRKEVPERTIAEAAELAAFYSDGRSQVRANVRYTQRKFVHKPKRSAPGMVSLSSFKTIYVEPKITIENLDSRD
jgi:predicted ribosome quality control (RQC) complex YloA/Tae2 family protein